MMKQLLGFLLLMALLAPPALAGGDGEDLDPVHHTADGYYLDFQPIGKVELPRLFLVRKADGSLGFDAFGSTKAALRSGVFVPAVDDEAHDAAVAEDHDAPIGEDHVEDGGVSFDQEPGSAEALIAAGTHLDAYLVRAEGKVIIDFSITRHLVFALLACFLLLLIFIPLARRYQRGVGRETAPKGTFQNLFETLIVFVRDDIARPNMGEKYPKFLPFLLTVFFFILFCNLMGLVPFGATATSNIMITTVLATFTFVLTQVNGSKDHWRHVFWPPGVPVMVKPIMIPVEILGLFTKPIALAIRLFANMTAGHLVILSLIGLIFTFSNLFGDAAGYMVSPVSIAFALFVMLLEVLIAFIQAYIFTILSALFIGMAIAEHDHHDEHHDAAHHPELPEEPAERPTPILADGNGRETVQEAETATLAPAG